MKKKLLVITNDDNIWLKPAWGKVLKSKKNNLNFKFITVPEKKIQNKNALFYYYSVFGPLSFLMLSILSVIRVIKFMRLKNNTFSKENTIKLESFSVSKIKKIITEYKPDIIFITCGYIIPEELINFQKNITWINKHSSLLPEAKGVFPYIYNKINKNRQGITFHYVLETIDTGDIVYIQEIKSTESMVSFYKEICDNFDFYFDKFFKNHELNIKEPQISGGNYFSYPNKKIMKKFFDSGGKIITLKDIVS